MTTVESGTGLDLEFQDLRKSFDELEVLKSFNLTVPRGEFVAIVGRSGCGKSTLLRLTAGLTDATEGSVRLDGEEVQGTHGDLRYLFQEPRLLPWKSVRDNVRIGHGERDGKAAQSALEAVGLGDRGKAWPGVLSGGQKQRVALARALVGSPRLLLLDEPLGALDALTRIEMQQLIEELWLKQGFTVILVTHDVAEAVALADRVLLIEEGAVTMDVRVGLCRPRVRDNDFVHYERLILDRVLGKSVEGCVDARSLEFAL